MRRFISLSYNGASFCGWQRQPSDPSVQQTIEEALARLLGHQVALTGAGRTDTGVNARRMFAHFDTDRPIASDSTFIRSLNALVGKHIAINDIFPVASDAHARFDATRRIYRYFAHTAKDPFCHNLSWQCSPALDFGEMNRAAERLLEVSDFTSFAKLHSDSRTNICRVDTAQWHDMGDGKFYFEIAADRFLRNMVRAVVGTLVEVGRGKISVDGFSQIIGARDRCAAGTSMPAHALFLWDVEYPSSIFV